MAEMDFGLDIYFVLVSPWDKSHVIETRNQHVIMRDLPRGPRRGSNSALTRSRDLVGIAHRRFQVGK